MSHAMFAFGFAVVAILATVPAAGAQTATPASCQGRFVDGGAYLRTIRIGQTCQGSLTEVDYLSNGRRGEAWEFDARQNDCVEITMRSREIDSFVGLYRPGPQVDRLAMDDDSAGNLDARMRSRLPVTGSYLIAATSAVPNQTGSYTLSVARCSR